MFFYNKLIKLVLQLPNNQYLPSVNLNAVVVNRILQKKIDNTKNQINSEMLNIIKEISVNIPKIIIKKAASSN